MPLASRITDLAVAIRSKFNAIAPRLLPAGGTTGQVLAKVSGADYAAGWTAPGYPLTVQRSVAVQPFTVTALADLTGLKTPLAANAVYRVKGIVLFESSALTLGAQIGFAGPAGCVAQMEVWVPTSAAVATAVSSRRFSQSSGSVATSSVAAVNTPMVAVLDGIVHTGGTAGDFSLQAAAAALLGTITVNAGSTLVVERLL